MTRVTATAAGDPYFFFFFFFFLLFFFFSCRFAGSWVKQRTRVRGTVRGLRTYKRGVNLPSSSFSSSSTVDARNPPQTPAIGTLLMDQELALDLVTLSPRVSRRHAYLLLLFSFLFLLYTRNAKRQSGKEMLITRRLVQQQDSALTRLLFLLLGFLLLLLLLKSRKACVKVPNQYA